MGVDKNAVEAQTLDWVRHVVVGLSLCPFAGRVLEAEKIHTRLFEGTDAEGCLHLLAQEAEALLQKEDLEATTLLILSSGFKGFDDYLDLVTIAGDLLDQLTLSDSIQLASFHPNYQFSGATDEDVANFTNRSPWPMLHLLQEQAVTKAVDSYPDPDSIPDRNVARLRQLSPEEFERRILRYAQP